MERQEAATFLKTILIECELSPEEFVILNPLPGEKELGKGHSILIKGMMAPECRKKIDALIGKSGLSLFQNEEGLMIYRARV